MRLEQARKYSKLKLTGNFTNKNKSLDCVKFKGMLAKLCDDVVALSLNDTSKVTREYINTKNHSQNSQVITQGQKLPRGKRMMFMMYLALKAVWEQN